MTLTNKNLIELSKFASKAKRYIGLVKAVEMFHDQQYACDILVKATLSDNDDLIDLTKKISSELNVGVNLISSIESYINCLKSSNATEDCIHDSKYYLIKLTHHLYGIDISGVSYRQAVNKLIKNLDRQDQDFCIKLAREYYQFWGNANKSLTEIDDEQALKLSIQKSDFIKLWDGIGREFFSDAENWSLIHYTEAMKKVGASEYEINIRQKIAKVITVELRRHFDILEDNYRNTINNIQHLFSSQEMKEFFLIVSREYYNFWIRKTSNKISIN